MNIAVYNSDRIIEKVIVMDFVPPSTEQYSFAECPSWCWIGDSIDKEKPTPSKEEQIAELDAKYEADKQVLLQYYLEFSVAGYTEGMESIKEELDNLNKQYDDDLKSLEGSE